MLEGTLPCFFIGVSAQASTLFRRAYWLTKAGRRSRSGWINRAIVIEKHRVARFSRARDSRVHRRIDHAALLTGAVIQKNLLEIRPVSLRQ